MASKTLSSDPGLGPFEVPTLALKQALCYFCLDVSSNLNRCSACKRVSYCSAKCQKEDWNRNHKKICKKLVALNKQQGCIPADGRNWDDYYAEQVQLLQSNAPYPCEIGRLIGRESQLGDGMGLNACQYCLLTSFCLSCEQAHSSAECVILQDIATDGKTLVDIRRRTGTSWVFSTTQLPKEQYFPLSSIKDWHDYYTRLSDKGKVGGKMNRDLKFISNDPKEREFVENLRHGTNMITIQLTLLAALETAIPNISTRDSIDIHFIGAGAFEYSSIKAFEELLHLLPSLKTLQLLFVGLHVVEYVPTSETKTEIHKPQNPRALHCCPSCIKTGRTVTITTWRGPYHAFVETEFYKKPDLATAFHSGFSVDEQADWFPTIKYLARAPNPTLFTAARFFEIKGEMVLWKLLGAGFLKNAEINKWKGMTPALGVCGDRPNEVSYDNYWWYIVKGV
ncbi:hypothetical protein NHQ30_003558 [Ciborinia camelliae]|nr:hypothetical protein NHQ30_003558 [Ciborinia camelliae]